MTRRRHIGPSAAALFCATALWSVAPAAAQPDAPSDDGFLGGLIERTLAELERVAKPVPPQPIDVRWKAARLGSVTLGAPVLAATTADLDGDGRAEIVLLTSRELVAVAVSGRRKLTVLVRAKLPSKPASRRARSPIGAVVAVERGGATELWARTSEQGAGGKYTFKDGSLVATADVDRYPLCGRLGAAIAPGRSYYDGSASIWHRKPARELALPAQYHSARCVDGVDGRGYQVSLVATVNLAGAVAVACERGSGSACEPGTAAAGISGQGDALAVFDFNRDGRFEVVTTRSKLAGASDDARVWTPTDSGHKKLYERRFVGSIAALATGDVDGDGATEAVVIVQRLAAGRVSIWSLN